ncbi:MAG: DUF131 domain-containing protein [Promethearchaeati archaeon SRVP18_Atabeyarchaeia-1]
MAMRSLGSLLSAIGFLILLIGIILTIIGLALSIVKRSSRGKKTEGQDERERGRTRGGGVVMIGPIPIIFGTDRKIVLIAVAVAIVFMVIYIVSMLLVTS